MRAVATGAASRGYGARVSRREWARPPGPGPDAVDMPSIDAHEVVGVLEKQRRQIT